jgi:hypothetical protein
MFQVPECIRLLVLVDFHEVRASGPSLPSSRSDRAVKGGPSGPIEASREAAPLTGRELRAQRGADRVAACAPSWRPSPCTPDGCCPHARDPRKGGKSAAGHRSFVADAEQPRRPTAALPVYAGAVTLVRTPPHLETRAHRSSLSVAGDKDAATIRGTSVARGEFSKPSPAVDAPVSGNAPESAC